MKTAFRFERMESPLGPMLLLAVDNALAGIHFDGQRHHPVVGADSRHDPGHPALRAAKAQLTEIGRAHV